MPQNLPPVNKAYTGSYSEPVPNSTPVFPSFASIGYVPVWTDNDHWEIKPINAFTL
jgi:hypothetical protein